jgi:hypothetical protein
VRRQKQGKNFESQIKTGLKESGLLQQPAKKIVSHFFEQFVFWAINIITALLLCPFSWRSIILEAIVLVFAILLSVKFIKVKKSRTLSLRLWTVAIIMFLLAAVCPFIIVSKPVYVAVTESNNPFASKVRWLKSGGRTVGSIILVSDMDFVRKGITSALNSVFPASFRVLERTDYGNRSYYKLPVFKGFIIDSKELGQITWRRSVYFPCDPFMRDINVKLVEPHLLAAKPVDEMNSIKIGGEITSMGLVNFEYTQYPDTIPWDCVLVQRGQEISILTYSALLDRALECFAIGNTPEAIKGLEAASSVIPPFNLEATRLAALQYVAANIYLGGSIGEMQSLPYLHRAYVLFLNSQEDTRFSERDPLTNWLRQVLLDNYNSWNWSLCFFDRISKLKAIPHSEDEQFNHVDDMRNNFEVMSYDELLKSVQSTNFSAVDLFFIRNSVNKRFLKRAMASMTLMMTKNSNIKLDEGIAVDAKKVIPIFKQIDLQLAKQYGLKMKPLFIQFVNFLAYEWPKIENTGSESETRKQIAVLAKTNSLINDLFMSVTMLADTNISIQIVQSGRKEEWWDIEYLIWFDSWGVNAIAEAYHHKYPYVKQEPLPIVGPGTCELLSQNGVAYFIKDTDGKGRTFLPGVFCMAWYAQEFGLSDYESLTNQFETETLIPFQTYLSSLYQVNRVNNSLSY